MSAFLLFELDVRSVRYYALSVSTEFGLNSELIFIAAIFLNFRNSSGCDSFQCYYWLCTLTVLLLAVHVNSAFFH
jgi:hypothetical protein